MRCYIWITRKKLFEILNSQVAELVDAARRELIGSVRFRRRKWCSSNTGSIPVLTTLDRITHYYKWCSDYSTAEMHRFNHIINSQVAELVDANSQIDKW